MCYSFLVGVHCYTYQLYSFSQLLVSIHVKTSEQDGYTPSATKKIYLEYATVNDAMNAEKELKGRAFGPNVVDATYFQEDDYARGNLQ